jgi:hypothetical protein
MVNFEDQRGSGCEIEHGKVESPTLTSLLPSSLRVGTLFSFFVYRGHKRCLSDESVVLATEC